MATLISRLKVALGDRKVPVAPPPGMSAFVPPIDPALAARDARDGASAASLYISYVKASGEASQRPITVKKLTGHHGEIEHVIAWCHARAKIRSFRADRITEMWCPETGELFDPRQRLADLVQFGAVRCEDQVLSALTRLLVFMARCDGSFHLLEQEALADALARYCLRFGGDDNVLLAALEDCRTLAPDAKDMLAAFRLFARAPTGPQICRFVLDSSGKMIDADGRHADEEVAWAVEMSAALKHIADRR
jgi:hypothetical protein